MDNGVKNTEKTQVKKVIGKPFQKGNSFGKGRPKKEFCIPELLRKQGNEIDPITKKTYYDAMVAKAWKQAAAGDKAARDWVSDRTEGKSLERIDQTVRQEPIKIIDID